MHRMTLTIRVDFVTGNKWKLQQLILVLKGDFKNRHRPNGEGSFRLLDVCDESFERRKQLVELHDVLRRSPEKHIEMCLGVNVALYHRYSGDKHSKLVRVGKLVHHPLNY